MDCAERFALSGVELGMAMLGPPDFGGDTLGKRLTLANGPANSVGGFLRASGLYEVGAWEADPVCVVDRN